MEIEALAIRLRPRSPLEAADLGVRLCQSCAKQVYFCYAMVFVPVAIISIATVEWVPWLPAAVIWWLKPWMDRTILFVLSRAAFAQTTTPREVWHAQRSVWWHHLFLSLTLRRLSPWRAFTQPAYQLEGLPLRRIANRIRQLRRARTGQALLMSNAFALAETSLSIALISLGFWFAPQADDFTWSTLWNGSNSPQLALVTSILYAVVVLFLEPFYVAAGFAMYLNRRAELEAWDIEQEFRRAFSH